MHNQRPNDSYKLLSSVCNSKINALNLQFKLNPIYLDARKDSRPILQNRQTLLINKIRSKTTYSKQKQNIIQKCIQNQKFQNQLSMKQKNRLLFKNLKDKKELLIINPINRQLKLPKLYTQLNHHQLKLNNEGIDPNKGAQSLIKINKFPNNDKRQLNIVNNKKNINKNIIYQKQDILKQKNTIKQTQNQLKQNNMFDQPQILNRIHQNLDKSQEFINSQYNNLKNQQQNIAQQLLKHNRKVITQIMPFILQQIRKYQENQANSQQQIHSQYQINQNKTLQLVISLLFSYFLSLNSNSKLKLDHNHLQQFLVEQIKYGVEEIKAQTNNQHIYSKKDPQHQLLLINQQQFVNSQTTIKEIDQLHINKQNFNYNIQHKKDQPQYIYKNKQPTFIPQIMSQKNYDIKEIQNNSFNLNKSKIQTVQNDSNGLKFVKFTQNDKRQFQNHDQIQKVGQSYKLQGLNIISSISNSISNNQKRLLNNFQTNQHKLNNIFQISQMNEMNQISKNNQNNQINEVNQKSEINFICDINNNEKIQKPSIPTKQKKNNQNHNRNTILKSKLSKFYQQQKNLNQKIYIKQIQLKQLINKVQLLKKQQIYIQNRFFQFQEFLNSSQCHQLLCKVVKNKGQIQKFLKQLLNHDTQNKYTFNQILSFQSVLTTFQDYNQRVYSLIDQIMPIFNRQNQSKSYQLKQSMMNQLKQLMTQILQNSKAIIEKLFINAKETDNSHSDILKGLEDLEVQNRIIDKIKKNHFSDYYLVQKQINSYIQNIPLSIQKLEMHIKTIKQIELNNGISCAWQNDFSNSIKNVESIISRIKVQQIQIYDQMFRLKRFTMILQKLV